MTDFRERVFESREDNLLKRLAGRIPGWAGYQDKEMRREADKMLRDYIAAQLERYRGHLTEYQEELLSSGGLGLMDDVERVQKKMQLLSDRLRTAVYGYAGWFDAVTIRENELNALYDYDTSILADVEQVAAKVQSFGEAVSKEEDVRAPLKSLKDLLVQLHDKVDRRRDVLIGAMPPVPAPPLVEEPAPSAETEQPPSAPTVQEAAPPKADEDLSPPSGEDV